MKQLEELALRVAGIIASRDELRREIGALAAENDELRARLSILTEEYDLLAEKVAALSQENAALSFKFDEAQTQAIKGLDALAERDQLSRSINELLVTIESLQVNEATR